MIDAHFTGLAALVLALTAMLHAARAALPVVVEAMRVRAESMRIDAKARADAELAERERAERCEEKHAARDQRDRERDAAHAAEIGTLRGMLAALSEELDELRRSMTAGHARQH